MLTNIVNLPVTKSLVKDSGMGKAVGAIEKHSLCRGSPNETVIQERVANIKEAWQASVKARKAQDVKDSPVVAKAVKRETPSSLPSINQPAVKKAKVDRSDDTKKSSLSSLLAKVSSGNAMVKPKTSSSSPDNGISKPETSGMYS